MVSTSRMRALDGIRALAVIAVLCFHGQALPAGYIGVDCFFVLSGFLITGLLLAESDATGRIDLRAFWWRRALRLLPALYVYLLAGLALTVALKPAAERRDFLTSLPALLVGAGNWWQAAFPQSLGAWSDHLWSLGVEQQFYLVWPLLLLGLLVACRRWPRLTPVRAVGAVLALVVLWRLLLLLAAGIDGDRVYLGTDTRADALLVGAFVAVLAREGVLARVPGAVWSRLAWVAAAALAAIAVLGPGLGPERTWLTWGGFTVVAGLAGVVVAAVTSAPDGAAARLLASRPLAGLGDISYAFYLWHYPVVIVLGGALAPHAGRPLALVASIAVSAGLAELSRRLVEAPFARRRAAALTRPRMRGRRVATGPVVARR